MTIEINRPWARAASVAPDTAGGFFAVANKGSEPDRLVAAASPAAEHVEIRGIKVVGTDIRMRPLESGIAFYPGNTVDLKPRGYHLLLTGLKAPFVQGAKVPVTLTFEKAGDITVEMAVEAPGPVGYETLLKEDQRG
jgi:periplasmic copper chaperone A